MTTSEKRRPRRRIPTNSKPFVPTDMSTLQSDRVWVGANLHVTACALQFLPDKTQDATMGLDITTRLLQKTRWVASKLPLWRFRFKKRSRMETTQLRPIALAGASRCFTGSSTLCNHFGRTPSGAQHEWGRSRFGGRDSSVMDSRWKICRMCERKFSPMSMSRQYESFCSLDCKSAFMLGRANE